MRRGQHRFWKRQRHHAVSTVDIDRSGNPGSTCRHPRDAHGNRHSQFNERPRTFTVPLATQIGTTLDTLPSAITGEASLALWPMVAGVNAHKDFAGKLTADQFPAGIWPIYFKYTSKTSSDRTDPTNGTSRRNFACSLNLGAGALVATVDGCRYVLWGRDQLI